MRQYTSRPHLLSMDRGAGMVVFLLAAVSGQGTAAASHAATPTVAARFSVCLLLLLPAGGGKSPDTADCTDHQSCNYDIDDVIQKIFHCNLLSCSLNAY